jgi:ABC-2 type transport system permease protein
MNIFKQELKMRLVSVIAWSASVAALIFVFGSLFPSFSAQAATVKEAMANFPPQLMAAFGLNGADITGVLGFFGFVFLFVQLCLAIQAANYGFSLVSVEEREWTADFLLSKPVDRKRVLTGKLLAAVFGLTVTDIVVWIVTLVSLAVYAGNQLYDTASVILLLLSIPLFQLFFLSVGLAVSLLVKRVRSVISYGLGLAFAMYVLNAFGNMLGTSVLEDITPFKHFDARYILTNSSWDLPLVSVTIVVIAAGIAASFLLYVKRDIPAVT